MNSKAMKINRDELSTAIDALCAAFVWDQSPQGGDYWEQVRSQLREMLMAAEEPRKPVEGYVSDLPGEAIRAFYTDKETAEHDHPAHRIIHLREVDEQ